MKLLKLVILFIDLPVDCDLIAIKLTVGEHYKVINLVLVMKWRAKICQILIESESTISVLIDETTSISKKSTLRVN